MHPEKSFHVAELLAKYFGMDADYYEALLGKFF